MGAGDEGGQLFGFRPGRGIHDIHMNQGNPIGSFSDDNGPWQDGGLVFEFPHQKLWTAVFLKFQTQAWHTDDKTGDPIDLGGGTPTQPPDPTSTSDRANARWSRAHHCGTRQRA